MPSFSMPSSAPDFAAAVPAADAATAGFNGANAPIAVAIAVSFLAVATVAVRAWVVFLMGGEDGEGQAFMMGAPPLERSLADLPSKEAPPMSPAAAAAGTGRSAPEILMGGLGNLGDAPFGWLFGSPSALYSTQPSADRLMWEGNKAAPSPPASTRLTEYAAYTSPPAAAAPMSTSTTKSRKKRKGAQPPP